MQRLARRQVHGDAEVRARPGGGLADRRLEHPRADPADRARLLGDRHEDVRRHFAEIGVTPAQQRLRARDLEPLQVDPRLVHDAEFAALERARQRSLHLQPPSRARLQLGRVERALRAAVLRLSQRGPRVLQQAVGVRPVVRADRYAGVRRGRMHAPVEPQRTVDARDEIVRQRLRVARRLAAGQHDDELAVPEVRDERCRAGARGATPHRGGERLLEARGAAPEQFLGRGRAERADHALDVVDPQHEHAAAPRASGGAQAAPEALAREATVRQARRGVVVRQLPDLRLRTAQPRDVLQRQRERRSAPAGRAELAVDAQPAHAGGLGQRHLEVHRATRRAPAFLDRGRQRGPVGSGERREQRVAAGDRGRRQADELREHRRVVQHRAVPRELEVPDAGHALRVREARLARGEPALQPGRPQQEADALGQQAGIQALLREVGRAGRVRARDRLDVVATRQHEDRHRPAGGVCTDRATGGEAVEHGHHHVQQHAVGARRLEDADRIRAVFRREHGVARARERGFHDHPRQRIVVGDEHRGGGRRHRAGPAAAPAAAPATSAPATGGGSS